MSTFWPLMSPILSFSACTGKERLITFTLRILTLSHWAVDTLLKIFVWTKVAAFWMRFQSRSFKRGLRLKGVMRGLGSRGFWISLSWKTWIELRFVFTRVVIICRIWTELGLPLRWKWSWWENSISLLIKCWNKVRLGMTSFQMVWIVPKNSLKGSNSV